MREISREEHEMILNLFIMEFMSWHIPRNKKQYNAMIGEDQFTLFYKVKDAFPMDEVCEEIRETTVTLSCACCSGYTYLPANYIKEV